MIDQTGHALVIIANKGDGKMKFGQGKIISSILTLSLSTRAFAVSASANSSNTESYRWNEVTNERTELFERVEKVPVIDETLDANDKDFVNNEPQVGDNSIQWVYETLVRYDHESAYTDWEAKYVGSTRVDNSDNLVTYADLIFKATEVAHLK
ncbi:hypothetical protein UACE39S_02447 [Ureibacillus acetophenoni]